MSRLDTKLESAGAEFLVCGQLLIHGIPAYKAYTNHPGYDIVAVKPESGTSARISVKSRWATDNDGGFPIRNFDCEFVVFVSLNRGYRYSKKTDKPDDGRSDLHYYVFPVDVVKNAQSPTSGWGKVYKRRMSDPESFRNRWDLIESHLSGGKPETSADIRAEN